jgi:hypothetical protein
VQTDHFEPASADQLREWIDAYDTIASRHGDSCGRKPQHTWFYWGKDRAELMELKRGCDRGLGEVEIHLHHSHDTAAGMKTELEERLLIFREAGLRASGPRIPYAFIHGYWSLDNSCGDSYCGVNNELRVLKETGCFADFTFPANRRAQPSKINSIYYAVDDPLKPKSYDTGIDVETGKSATGDLMIFQGPGTRSGYSRLGKLPLAQKILERLFVYSDISHTALPTPRRVRAWVRQNIHVKGRPEWVFVKVHMHGARYKDYRIFFGKSAERMYSVLENEYNDGRNWVLHYVTAREAYNIVKAAEAGKTGDAGNYREYAIPDYCERQAVL